MLRVPHSVVAGFLLLVALPAGSTAQEREATGEGLADAPFTLNAEEVSYEPDRDTYEAAGNVRVEQEGGRGLSADWLAFNATTRVGIASGNVRIRDGEDTVSTEFAAVDLNTLVAIATHAVLDAGTSGFVIKADPIHKTGTNTYNLDNATFTTCRCPPESECTPWHIRAEQAEIRVGGYAVARNATFNVLDIPVLYAPWFIVPVKTERQSGFLIPHLSSDSRSGTALETPFFWAARDNVNVLLRPTYYSKRGFKGGAELEYVFGEEGYGSGGAAILPGDKDVDRDDPKTPYSDDRWTYWLRHHQPLGRGLLFGAEVERISDNHYVVDFEDRPTGSRHARFLDSSGWGIAGRGPLYLDAELVYFDDLQSPDNLDRDDFVLHRLPDVEFTSLPRRVGRLPLWAGLGARYTHFYQKGDSGREAGLTAIRGQFFDTGSDALFDAREPNPKTGIVDGDPSTDKSLDNAASVTGGTEGNGLFDEGELLADDGHRLDLYPRIGLPLQLGPLETLSEVGFRETLYWADEEGSERREIWTARFDARTRFQRSFELQSLALHHLVEPKLAFVLVSAPNQTGNPLFVPRSSLQPERLIIADGRVLTRDPADRIQNERLLQFSLGSRFFAASPGAGHAGRMVGKLSLGSGYDFERGRMANLYLDGSLAIWDHLALALDASWDPKDSRLEEASAGISWFPPQGHELALSYRYLRQEFVIPTTSFDFDDDVFGDFDADFDRINQLSLRGRWLLSSRWELFGEGYYSLEESSNGEAALGVLFRSRCDCWELIGELEQRTRPSETRFSLRFNLTGLGQSS